jgi:hypothetical protein
MRMPPIHPDLARRHRRTGPRPGDVAARRPVRGHLAAGRDAVHDDQGRGR